MDAHIEALRALFSYDPLTGVITWAIEPGGRAHAGDEAGCLDGNGYRTIGYQGRYYLGHRLAFALHHGRWPEPEADHEDRDPANNRITNLRECEHFQNCANRDRALGASGLRGVTWNKRAGKWQAQIKARNTNYYLGLYDLAEDAHAAYAEAQAIHHGTFARAA